MRFTEADGHRVVSTSTATTVGKVAGFLVDPSAGKVVGLRLKKVHGDGDTLPWQGLTAFGPDAATVPGADAIVRADGRLAELSGKPATLLGKRVLDESGDDQGKLRDVEFDPETGAVTGLVTDELELDGARLLGVGSYAVVVRRS